MSDNIQQPKPEPKENVPAIETEFRLLVERVEEYAIFMLDPAGRVMTWNAGAEKIKGYSRSEIIGKSFECFYTPEEREQGKPARLLGLAKTQGHVRDEGPRVRKDGSIFQADVLITAVRDESGKLHGFGKVTRDLADQMRTRALQEEKSAAEVAGKMKDEFLAVLSHELRTPLTPVLAAASYLVENAAQLPEDLREVVGTLHRNARLEAQLIDDLLDLTRIARGKIELRLEAVDVHGALNDVLKICERDRAAKRIEIANQCEANQHWIWADPTRIRQVYWNLLNNAVKFTPESGRIVVHSSNQDENEVIVEICDTGIGIESSQLERIFNAFEQGERTVTRRFGGLGLGLAITRSLVEMQGGKISARSAGKGNGATFSVSFGIAPEGQEEARSAEPTPFAPKKLRILLVDDHDDTRRLLARLLLRRGHKVSTASSMQDALKLLEDRHDVLISDIGLPDGSGLELMQAARSRGKIRGIALSGFGMPEDMERSARAGFEHHLIKPLDVQTLQSILEQMTTD